VTIYSTCIHGWRNISGERLTSNDLLRSRNGLNSTLSLGRYTEGFPATWLSRYPNLTILYSAIHPTVRSRLPFATTHYRFVCISPAQPTILPIDRQTTKQTMWLINTPHPMRMGASRSFSLPLKKMHRIQQTSRFLSQVATPPNSKKYEAVVVGAGPAGVAVVGNLLEQNRKPILWVDDLFQGGRLNKYYREVPR